MPDVFAAALPHTDGSVPDICRSIGGALLARGDLMAAREVLAALVKAAGHGKTAFLRQDVHKKTGTPDIRASLWLSVAGYDYFQRTRDIVAWRMVLLPYLKRVGQAVVAGTFPGVKMADSGLLEYTRGQAASVVELNLLWYNLMAMLAAELHVGSDHAGDHFERLSGRFRRAFLRGFWCATHGALCDPRHIAAPDHANADLDPNQLLAGTLPHVPIPRTRQQQLVQAVERRGRRPMGVLVPRELLGKRVPADELARPLYLAWLAEAWARTGDHPATAIRQAREFLTQAHDACQQYAGKLARYYTAAGPVKTPDGQHGADGPEVQRVWAALAGGKQP